MHFSRHQRQHWKAQKIAFATCFVVRAGQLSPVDAMAFSQFFCT